MASTNEDVRNRKSSPAAVLVSSLIIGMAASSWAGCAQPGRPTEQCADKGSSMGGECCMGFRELFTLAKKRLWTADEERYFKSVDQPTRNKLVKDLAHEAGCIATEDRVGTDGQTYTAFWKVESR